MENMGTCIVASVQIIIFSISCSYFEVVVHGTSAQYFFLDSLTINIREKCVMNIINVFDVISKKIETWELKHSCKGPNHSFFNFVLLFWGCCTWNWCMIYFFLASLTLNIWKKCVTNVIIVLGIILKKCRTWALKQICKGPNHSFFDFVLLFWGGCPWNWCTTFFFWILWRPNNGKSVSWISLICWT